MSLVCLALVSGMLAIVAWNVLAWPHVGALRGTGRDARARIAILIPARDEAATIGDALHAAAAQGPAVAEILVYDDRSTDRTAALVEAFAAHAPRVRLLRGADLPAGWCGKPHACMRLAEAARADWLLFLDADARLHQHGAARLLQDAEGRGQTLLSAWPRLEMAGAWEQLLMPLLNLVVFSLYPAPLSLVRRDPSLGLAHGACILAHRETYLALGGHARVRDQLFEDSRLAQAWRAQGGRGLCLDGQTVVSVRMYDSAAGIWSGFQKNFYPAFRRAASFWAFLGLHVTAFVLPAALLVVAPSPAAAAALAGAMLMRLLLALRFRHPAWSALLHPLAELALVGIGLSSWWRFTRGGGVRWKDRRYGPGGQMA